LILQQIKQDKNHIIFDVHDTGVGMDKETKENLFNLFFSSKVKKGTRLELFISNNFIQQHSGSITVESIPGKGSHFCIGIPKILPELVKNMSREEEPKRKASR